MAVLLEDIVRAMEAWLKILKEPEPYVDPNLDPVLLVPGIGGSILKAVDNETGKEERVWVRLWEADQEFRAKLWSRFDSSTGKTVSMDPKTTIMVPEDRFGLYAIDCLDPDMILGRDSVCYFHDLIVEMTSWGYQEGKTLFGFGYDFRQSNRLQETMDGLASKLDAVYTASGGKKINIISHSMGGLLVKCFMGLHSDIFEKYVKSWIAVCSPFQGAPGYVTSSFLNGMTFVEGWEEKFFISKWTMHQLLIECPSLYELMACLDFHWEHEPLLEIWKEVQTDEGNSIVMLEKFTPVEAISIFSQALSINTVSYGGVDFPLPFNKEILQWANKTRQVLSSAKLPPPVKFYNVYGTGLDTPQTVSYGSADSPVLDLHELPLLEAGYINADGDGTVPAESAKADGMEAEARVGIPGEHRGILLDKHLFRVLKHWLHTDHDPFYNPVNDYVVLPTLYEMERRRDKGVDVTSLKEEWELVSGDQETNAFDTETWVGSISASCVGDGRVSAEEARATLVVHPRIDGKRHVELNATGMTAGGA